MLKVLVQALHKGLVLFMKNYVYMQTVLSSEEEFGKKAMAAQAKGPRFNLATSSFLSSSILPHNLHKLSTIPELYR